MCEKGNSKSVQKAQQFREQGHGSTKKGWKPTTMLKQTAKGLLKKTGPEPVCDKAREEAATERCSIKTALQRGPAGVLCI